MIEYVEDNSMNRELDQLLRSRELIHKYPEFNMLRKSSLRLRMCAKVKTNKEGENEQSIKRGVEVKKIPPAIRTFVDFDYLIVMDYYCWTHETPSHELLFHRALRVIHVEQDEDKKWKSRLEKPLVQDDPITLARFGAECEPTLSAVAEFKSSEEALALIFGPARLALPDGVDGQAEAGQAGEDDGQPQLPRRRSTTRHQAVDEV